MEVVHFPSASIPNSSASDSIQQSNLWGHLAVPDGAGPHPAIILLHGCGGIQQSHFNWAKTFNQAGFATLVVDSFRPRSLIQVCGDGTEAASPIVRVLDAYGALQYLAGLETIDPERVGLIGWSHGAISALGAVSSMGVGEKFSNKFQAVTAMYPYCIVERTFFKPVTILIGASDDWTPAPLCIDLKENTKGHENEVDLTVFPGVFHAFDDPSIGSGFHVPGAHGQMHWLQYNRSAHQSVLKKVQAFFKAKL